LSYQLLYLVVSNQYLYASHIVKLMNVSKKNSDVDNLVIWPMYTTQR